MSKTAWIFPGQGSQSLGMEANLLQYSGAEKRLAQAEEILNWSVLDLCRDDEEKLNKTLYTQPCLYVIESILADFLLETQNSPDILAGHSLGEYVSLYAARVFDFETGLKLVKKRAELMSEAVGGKMVAIMKFDRNQLEEIVAATSDVVIANDNSPQQVVISGTPTGVDEVLAKIEAKRTVTLKVSGAFHSPLMESAAVEFAEVLKSVSFAEAKIPVISNVAITPTTKAEELKNRLTKQMTGPVRWREITELLAQLEVTEVVEIGPGKVLSGLVQKTCPQLTVRNISQIHEFAY